MSNIYNKLIRLLQILYIIFLLSYCKSVYNFDIQVLTPALVTIPSDIQKVLLVNHSNYMKSIFLDANMNRVEKNIDSLYSNEYLAALNDILDNSPRFEVGNTAAIYLLKDSYTQQFALINWDTASALCKQYNADALIVLENYTFPFNPTAITTYMPDQGLYHTKITVENSALWKIYKPFENKIIDDCDLKDTSVWNVYDANLMELQNKLPTKEQVIYQSCYETGAKYGKRIAQEWHKVNRIIYNYPNVDFQKALNLALNSQWKEAVEIWKKYPYRNKKNLAAMASFNIAVGCEALDDIDAALDWAAKSYFLKKSTITKDYINILEKRNEQKNEVIKQMGN
jgi:hypothetical protein